ncbi:hypothetical protein PTSG_08488 [Salpingoeca rosetta]|uniref:Mitochondrial inner membrane protease subunit n=1 Tax=Salpingoeca rosetta (strain ATCC 50818 / BSB-021) TaxID=946362 RepID=F2UJU4_SALR5|nr:uncharacterized protein PTSG_08488 [Salpingoeca rosetta]EGD77393.1 hypothetical protein PTSG_08488 [Salpingoeca rosetta]|eukprot:XP_004990737.1 hypothetical protein PTSG_08488 [Salpingoeca rosetta]
MRKLLQRVGVSVALAVTVSDVFVSVMPVQGTSMQPTLNPDAHKPVPTPRDWVLVNKTVQRFSSVQRGDVVVMKSPTDPKGRMVKRVLGKEFDVVRPRAVGAHLVTLRAGHMWVEGDNADRTIDSNSFGPVSESMVQGRVECVVWPPSRWGRVRSQQLDSQRLVYANNRKKTKKSDRNN